MTTNPTPADHATKPSERILARARIIACWPLNETPPDKYTLRALLEHIDEQAASANPAAPPSGEVAAPSPVERAILVDSTWREKGDHLAHHATVCRVDEEDGVQFRMSHGGTFETTEANFRISYEWLSDPQAPQAEATPPEPDDECNTESDTCEICGLVVHDGDAVCTYSCSRCERIVCDNCCKPKYGPGVLCVECLNPAVEPPNDSFVTAVRRISLTEPEPVPESGGQTTCPLCNGTDWAQQRGYKTPCICVAPRLTKERDDLRSKVSELEAELEHAVDRLKTIVDEACGLQPADTSPDDLLSLIEADNSRWRAEAFNRGQDLEKLRACLCNIVNGLGNGSGVAPSVSTGFLLQAAGISLTPEDGSGDRGAGVCRSCQIAARVGLPPSTTNATGERDGE